MDGRKFMFARSKLNKNVFDNSYFQSQSFAKRLSIIGWIYYFWYSDFVYQFLFLISRSNPKPL